MDETPDPARRGAYITLLEIALNQLKYKGSTADEIAEEIASGETLLQVGMVAGFYLDSNLKGC